MLYPVGKQKRRLPVVKFLSLILLLCAETANSQTLWGGDWKTATPGQIQKLIDDGASVTDDLLILAAGFNSNPAVIEALIKAQADINARTGSGTTPLMIAARFNSNPAVIEALIKAKANVNVRDMSGKTAFDYAEDNPEIKGTPAYWKLNDLMYK